MLGITLTPLLMKLSSHRRTQKYNRICFATCSVLIVYWALADIPVAQTKVYANCCFDYI